MMFNKDTGDFTYAFRFSYASKGDTQIFYNDDIFYPQGYKATVVTGSG